MHDLSEVWHQKKNYKNNLPYFFSNVMFWYQAMWKRQTKTHAETYTVSRVYAAAYLW